MVISSSKVLEAFSWNFVSNNNHQKDAQQKSMQKDVLNSPPPIIFLSIIGEENVDENYQSGT